MRDNKKAMDQNAETIKHLVLSLATTCNRMDTIGNNISGTKFDCCISAANTASVHDRSGIFCVNRNSAGTGSKIPGITISDTCGVCPSSVNPLKLTG